MAAARLLLGDVERGFQQQQQQQSQPQEQQQQHHRQQPTMCREHAGPGWVDVVRIGGGSEDNITPRAKRRRTAASSDLREDGAGAAAGGSGSRAGSARWTGKEEGGVSRGGYDFDNKPAAVGRSECNSDSSSNNHFNIGGGSIVDPGGPAVGGGEGSHARAGVTGALGEVTRSGRLVGRPKGVNDQCPHPNSKHYCHGKCKVCYMKEYNQKTRMQGTAGKPPGKKPAAVTAGSADGNASCEPESGYSGVTTLNRRRRRRSRREILAAAAAAAAAASTSSQATSSQAISSQATSAQATSSQATSSRATSAQRTTAGEAVAEGQAGGTTISDKHWR
ncbi:unnamed protein product, partial [Ectocarpus sp. 12 AP-2014]